ncbi:MAG: DUF4982 domain-containing protein, partial [Massilibacteroides sp.]|nr:DUF4982 domain-containing protein [Massilibacteroides sp.]
FNYLLMTLCIAFAAEAYNGDGVSFNEGWLFYKGEASGAEQVQFQDQAWKALNLPHDWAIYGPFDIKYNARCGGLPFHGTGWYRKHFTADASWKDKTVRVAFDGAMNDSYVWINGHLLGNRPYGYIGFEYDLTKYLKFGEDNVIAVRLTPKDLSSRWYPGAGLYRNTWLKVDKEAYVGQYGTFITTPTATEKLGVVQIETEVVNASAQTKEIRVAHEIFDKDNHKVLTIEDKVTIKAHAKGLSQIYSPLANPQLWSIEQPNLYTVTTKVMDGNATTDVYKSRFGFRTIEFTHDGFYLNHKKVHFNGVCLHHDNGPLGTELNVRADQRKLEVLRSMGVNAIRTSHNPQSPEFLDLCDQMGFVVLAEAFDEWKAAKVDNGYHVWFDQWAVTDIQDMVRRDRNHPCVIMWSLGNEILEQHDKLKGWTIAKQLGDAVHVLDLTRPTTCGFNNYPAPFDFNMAQQLGVSGMNYKPAYYAEIYKKYPDLVFYGSETESCTSSRGVYHLPIKKYTTHPSKQVTSYDIVGPAWAYPPDLEFYFEKKNPQIMGEFMWTGFDYLGEPTPYGGRDNSTNGHWNGDWPSRSSYFGAIDLAGFPKDRYYLYQSEWTTKPMVHILPHWNWKGMEGQEIPVFVYTNADKVELFLNGESLGTKVKGVDKTTIPVSFNGYASKTFDSPYRLSWNVPYKAGSLVAKAYKGGKQVAEQTINTAGRPYQVVMTADRKSFKADGKDLSYITVRIEDKAGNLCFNADNLVNFTVKGAGHLKAVGNGNAATVASFQAKERKAFSGMCLLVVQADEVGGEISVKASSKRLRSSKLMLTTTK